MKDETTLVLKGWLDHRAKIRPEIIYHLTNEVLSNRYSRRWCYDFQIKDQHMVLVLIDTNTEKCILLIN